MIQKSLSNCSFVSTLRRLWMRKKAKSYVNFGHYSIVQPRNVTPQRSVPDHIKKPSYYANGIPNGAVNEPERKTSEQIAKMRKSCTLAANILKYVGNNIYIGQTTDEIDTIVHNLTLLNNAYPSPLNYNKYPKSVCTSVNNVACHGIPDDRPLEDGDIINIDVTVYLDGYHGDCSSTFAVGNVDRGGFNLMKSTKQSMEAAIEICKPGVKFKEIGSCIEKIAYDMGYNVIPIFAGHGIGEYFHGPPDIYHVENDYPYEMATGMTFTIEPILSQGTWQVEILRDNWTAVTVDDSRSAQYEHTVLITENSVEILTKPDDNFDVTKGTPIAEIIKNELGINKT